MRRKDRYIGRLYSDIGKVPSDSGIFRSTRELLNSLGEVVGLNGPYGKGEKGLKGGRAPSPWTGPNWTRERGRPLPSFSFSLQFSYSNKERRSPTPGGSRTPPLARPPPSRRPPPSSFIYGGKGHPKTQQLIIDLLAVCGAPSTIIHLGHIVAVLRRSPASVTSSTPSLCRRADRTL